MLHSVGYTLYVFCLVQKLLTQTVFLKMKGYFFKFIMPKLIIADCYH